MHTTDSHTIRPRLAPGVPVVELEARKLRIGADIERSICIDGGDHALLSWIRQLDGQCSTDTQIQLARALGIDAHVALEVLDTLAEASLVVDGDGNRDPLESLPNGAISVVGAGPIVKSLLANLPTQVVAVVADVDRTAAAVTLDLRDTELAILVMRNSLPDRTELAIADYLASSGVSYLPAGVGSNMVRVGPLVVPGRSPCLRCEDESRADIDRDWRAVSLQMTLDAESGSDSLAALGVAAEVLRDVRRYAGLRSLMPQATATMTVGGIRRADVDGGPWRHQALHRHPACGCAWR